MSMIVIQQNVTLEQVRAAKPKMIYYGAKTCWWTHDADDLRQATGGPDDPSPMSGPLGPIPTDPRGGVLFETDKPEEFLRNAEAHIAHYGKHGLAAFMAAHHQNCILVQVEGAKAMEAQARRWCMASWQEYNDAIDATERTAEGGAK